MPTLPSTAEPYGPAIVRSLYHAFHMEKMGKKEAVIDDSTELIISDRRELSIGNGNRRISDLIIS